MRTPPAASATHLAPLVGQRCVFQLLGSHTQESFAGRVHQERFFLCFMKVVCRLKPRRPGDSLLLWHLLIGAAYVCGVELRSNPPRVYVQGVLYSHRANFLHAFTVSMPDASCMTSATSVLAVVPAFHANCWGLLFAAPLVGAKLVMPGVGQKLQNACMVSTLF